MKNLTRKTFLSFLLVKNKAEFQKSDDELITEVFNKAKAAKIVNKKSIYLDDSPNIKKQIANKS